MKRVNSGQFTRERTLGENNPHWKGDQVGYSAVHAWMYRTYGKAKRCAECKSEENVEWANISHKYKRDINDWKQLCASCHDKFDGIAKLTKEQASRIKEEYLSGKRQRFLASQFGVSQMTISNIVRNKTKYYA